MVRLDLCCPKSSVFAVSPVLGAEKQYGPGVTDTEIRIGQTIPYSGPLSNLSSFGRVEAPI